MDSTTNNSDFDDVFLVKFVRYGEWVKAAQNAGNLQECRERTEAVIIWLEQQKNGAPVETCAKIDSMIAQLSSAVASLPNSRKIPPLPDVVTDEAQLVEAAKKSGAQAVHMIALQFAKIPPELAQAIKYCLAATQGIPAPGSPLECHQVFALACRNLGASLIKKDPADVSNAIRQLEDWSNFTALNSGFERAKLLRCIHNITSGITAEE